MNWKAFLCTFLFLLAAVLGGKAICEYNDGDYDATTHIAVAIAILSASGFVGILWDALLKLP
ncbi:MAG: hypothetical protein IJ418_02070 [Clostridia bacterium]|nr:hypothetical protein [Clostridia bacterium]